MIRVVTFDAEATPAVRAAATRVLNVPQKHLGRDTDGVDCAGQCQLLYRPFGIDCRLPTGYALRWWHSYPMRIFAHLDLLGWRKVVSGPASPLDLLVFAVATRDGDHCGVFTGRGQFVHCWAEKSTEESLLTDGPSKGVRWVDRLVAVYRPNVT